CARSAQIYRYAMDYW
nr:immunoglobulin heavy chain junction region [Mus musculus]